MLLQINKDQKIKRILVIYSYMAKHRLEPEECLEYMSYVFHLDPAWLTRVIKQNRVEDFSKIRLEHLDLDLNMVDQFVLKLHKNTISERKRNKKHE